MKHLHSVFFGFCLALLLSAPAAAAANPPDCLWPFVLLTSGQIQGPLDNRGSVCNTFTLDYVASGFSALSIVIQEAQGANTPGTFGTYTGTVSAGSNPNTGTTSAETRLSGYRPWMQVKLTSATGTGTIRGVLYGYKTGTASTGGGAPTGPAGGDLNGTYPNPGVFRLNGVSLAGLGTGLLKNTTATGIPSIAITADVIALWSGTCSAVTVLHGAGACGAVSLTADVSGVLPFANGGLGLNSWTANALLKGNGSATPTIAGVTVDSSDGVSAPGGFTSGAGTGIGGALKLTQGTLPSFPLNSFSIYVGTSIPTAYQFRWPAADPGAGVLASDGGATPSSISAKALTGTGAKVVSAVTAGSNGNCVSWTGAGDIGDAGAACGSGGGGGAAGSNLFSTVASATATAVTATSLIGTLASGGSTTVPANTFTAGQILHLTARGFYTTPATPASLTIDLKLGGSVRITTGSVLQLASVTSGVWNVECDVTTRTTGVSGTQIANCIFVGTGSTLTPAEAPMQTSSTWTIDTTATQVVDLAATWSTTTNAPTITSTNVAAWIPGAPVTSVNTHTGAVTTTTQTTFAGLSATCGLGDVNFFTDSLYPFSRCSAANTWTYFADGKSWGLPSATFTSWNNQSTATLSETNGYSVVTVPSSHAGGLAYRFATITALVAFDHTFLFRLAALPSGTGVNRLAPVALSDGSKCIVFSPYTNGTSQLAFTVTTYTDAACSTGGANPTADVNFAIGGIFFYIHIVQDGTNITVSYGDDGNNYTQHYQASRTAVFGTGATRLGFGGYKASATQLVQLVGYN